MVGTQGLLIKNAKVYMACRSRQRAKEAIEDLKRQTGKEAIFLELDLAHLKSIKASVESFLRCVALDIYLGLVLEYSCY